MLLNHHGNRPKISSVVCSVWKEWPKDIDLIFWALFTEPQAETLSSSKSLGHVHMCTCNYSAGVNLLFDKHCMEEAT